MAKRIPKICNNSRVLEHESKMYLLLINLTNTKNSVNS